VIHVRGLPRITVEVPVVNIGSRPTDYEELGNYVNGLRRVQGLHMTLLHIGILPEFVQDISDWTKGLTPAEVATRRSAAWLRELPVLPGFSGTAERLIALAGGNVSGLEVHVPQHVHDFQIFLVQALRGLLEDLQVDNVDDFILSSPALGFRYPRWVPHVAVGRPKSRSGGSWEIRPLTLDFGQSQIRNAAALPAAGDA
jgi:hypothetical protein